MSERPGEFDSIHQRIDSVILNHAYMGVDTF